MSDNKVFYWLKLNEDFFDDDTIKYIEEQENGIKYSNFYLKLCLKSLRTKGRLIRLVGEMLIPYDTKSLASLTGVDVDTVRCAMALFQQIGCVKVLDSGELFISQLSELVGSETDKARLMRRRRAEEKAIREAGVTMLPDRYPSVTKCYTEIEKEIEIEQEKETEKDKDSASVASVLLLYRDKVNAEAAPATLDKLRAYCDAMGAECCMRAIQIALDEKKPLWSYIQGILRNKLANGVRCIEDWDRLDREWEERKGRETQKSGQKVAWNDPDYYKHDEGDGF